MSDLRPRGVALEVNGVERHLLFTLNAIDEIQSQFGMTLDEVLDNIVKEHPTGKTILTVTQILLSDEAEREKYKNPESPLESVSEKEIGWFIGTDNYLDIMKKIFAAYSNSLPESDDDDPNAESGQQNS